MQNSKNIWLFGFRDIVCNLLKPTIIAAATFIPFQAANAQLATASQIPELMKAYEVDGLAVTAVQGDQIIISKGFGFKADGEAYTSSSQCGLFSATKTLASLTYANLWNDDRINLDAPLSQYIKDSPDKWSDIAFYRLLNHTSGITMIVNKKIFGELASNPASQNDDIYRAIKDAPLDYQPGQYSRYRQSGYAVAEMILRKNLGVQYNDLVAQYITRPANMINTHHISKIDAKEPSLLSSSGGYLTNADDMAKLFLNINNGKVIRADKWLALMQNPKYRFDDYSLGGFFDDKDDILTIGHRGGGARANIRYAPEQKIGVMVCTDDTKNNELTITLAQMLIYEIATGEKPLTPIRLGLAGYKNKSANEIVTTYKALAAKKASYDFAESASMLNMIGYEMLGRDEFQDAITIFLLAVEVSPQSSNAHDSLAEAYLKSGNNEKALFHYQKAFSLEPKNTDAQAMITKILASIDSNP